jgi:hypothetical protein
LLKIFDDLPDFIFCIEHILYREVGIPYHCFSVAYVYPTTHNVQTAASQSIVWQAITKIISIVLLLVLRHTPDPGIGHPASQAVLAPMYQVL